MTKVTVSIGKRSEHFVLFQTSAPSAYDNGACIELYDGTVGGKVERYVLIPEHSVEWQRMRNHSGLHSFNTEDLLLDEDDLAKYLWQRIYGQSDVVEHLDNVSASLETILTHPQAQTIMSPADFTNRVRITERARELVNRRLRA